MKSHLWLNAKDRVPRRTMSVVVASRMQWFSSEPFANRSPQYPPGVDAYRVLYIGAPVSSPIALVNILAHLRKVWISFKTRVTFAAMSSANKVDTMSIRATVTAEGGVACSRIWFACHIPSNPTQYHRNLGVLIFNTREFLLRNESTAAAGWIPVITLVVDTEHSHGEGYKPCRNSCLTAFESQALVSMVDIGRKAKACWVLTEREASSFEK